MKRPEILDPAAAGAPARAGFSRAFMSDTEWRKLIAAVRAAREDVHGMTVQFIDAAGARQMRFPPELRCPWPYIDTIEYGPVELRSIEWMEFDADLTDVLDPIGKFPIELTTAGPEWSTIWSEQARPHARRRSATVALS